ncbi:histone-lysine N-methyltransferase SETMAR [Trichonephila clavipes]|nr:histone-lysine N-methyltransferase SETMAR [Trichonephila clavipes]
MASNEVSGRGSLVVKVKDRGWHVTSSSPVSLNTHRVGERYKRSPVGLAIRRGGANSGKNASHVAKIANGVYGANTVTANYVQFWFRRFRSGIFDVKDAPHTCRPVVDKITEIIEFDRLVSSRSIAQGLKIDHKKVLSHLRKVEFKKKLHVWVPYQLTPKNMMDRISICKALAKRNEIDPFLKWMVAGDEKWVTYHNIVRKRSWSKCGEAAQTVAKPGLTVRKALLCIWWDWKGISY